MKNSILLFLIGLSTISIAGNFTFTKDKIIHKGFNKGQSFGTMFKYYYIPREISQEIEVGILGSKSMKDLPSFFQIVSSKEIQLKKIIINNDLSFNKSETKTIIRELSPFDVYGVFRIEGDKIDFDLSKYPRQQESRTCLITNRKGNEIHYMQVSQALSHYAGGNSDEYEKNSGSWLINRYLWKCEDIYRKNKELAKQKRADSIAYVKQVEEENQLILEQKKIRDRAISDSLYKQEELHKQKERFLLMVNTYGKEIGTDINNGLVRLGFTKEMCTHSWGEPTKVNRTITSGLVSEQWVYERYREIINVGFNSYDEVKYEPKYLYFENGTLNVIQD